MSQIALMPKYAEECGVCNGEEVHKVYLMGGEEVSGVISPYSVAPLRILTYVMNQKGMDYKVTTNGADPWAITQILLDEKDADYVKIALQEIMEYRCSYELDDQCKEIIRQLPFEVAMRTSQNIMNFGKSPEDHSKDMRISSLNWSDYGRMTGQWFMGNPSEENYNLVIPSDAQELRKHLIYKSMRGGYNIKTKGYADSSLDHYCYIDSNRWD